MAGRSRKCESPILQTLRPDRNRIPRYFRTELHRHITGKIWSEYAIDQRKMSIKLAMQFLEYRPQTWLDCPRLLY